MLGLYLFCLGIGGVLLAASLFADADAPDEIGDAGWQQVFSLRNLTYFLFVFGAIGSVLAFFRDWKTGMSELVIAGGSGLVVAGIAHAVFAYVRRTDTAEVPADRGLVGRAAQVTLPIGRGAIGKIELVFGGQRVELLARPFGSEGASIENGTEVVIVEMDAGTALVSPASMD